MIFKKIIFKFTNIIILKDILCIYVYILNFNNNTLK